MNWNTATWLLAAATPEPPQGPPAWTTFVPMVFIFVVMYFLFMRPEQKRARLHAEMIKALKAGDKVATSGGIVGVVVTVKDRTVTLRSADSKMEVLRDSIKEVTDRGGDAPPAKDSKE